MQSGWLVPAFAQGGIRHPTRRTVPLAFAKGLRGYLQSGMSFFPVFLSNTRRMAIGICCLAALATAAAQEAGSATAPNQRVERITHEDGGSRVDEVRVGGVTRQIDVQTKSGLPAYQVAPTTSTQGTVTSAGERSGSQGSAGRASWRLLNF